MGVGELGLVGAVPGGVRLVHADGTEASAGPSPRGARVHEAPAPGRGDRLVALVREVVADDDCPTPSRRAKRFERLGGEPALL